MLPKFFLLFNLINIFIINNYIECREIRIQALTYDAIDFHQRNAIPIVLEHARTEEEMTWGLMQRELLPSNQGMLFYYPNTRKVTLWSFNCLIDLSVAFLNEEGAIQEIRTLHAYPQNDGPLPPGQFHTRLRDVSLQ